MLDTELKPEVIVFAGPNGSGKTTITKMAKTVGVYINADDIKKASLCSDMDAAIQAEKLREDAISKKDDFTFETVLSTDRNLKLLRKAKEKGYFVRCVYVLARLEHSRKRCDEDGVYSDEDVEAHFLKKRESYAS